jgi:hypothetical protein
MELDTDRAERDLIKVGADVNGGMSARVVGEVRPSTALQGAVGVWHVRCVRRRDGAAGFWSQGGLPAIVHVTEGLFPEMTG